jgi:hypothetical protein
METKGSSSECLSSTRETVLNFSKFVLFLMSASDKLMHAKMLFPYILRADLAGRPVVLWIQL